MKVLTGPDKKLMGDSLLEGKPVMFAFERKHLESELTFLKYNGAVKWECAESITLELRIHSLSGGYDTSPHVWRIEASSVGRCGRYFNIQYDDSTKTGLASAGNIRSPHGG